MVPHLLKERVFQIPSGNEEKIEHLRKWLKGQPHLPALTDRHLYTFLHSSMFQLIKAKQKIENYYTLRTHSPDLFSNRDPFLPEIQAVLDICNMVLLDWNTPEGYKVFLCRIVDYDTSKFNFSIALKMLFMYTDMQLSQYAHHPGCIVIGDLTGASLGHLARLNISTAKKAITYVQDCQPIALKGIHVIHTVPFIDKVMTMVKPFINNEIMEMLHFHGPPEQMNNIVPLEHFPSEYGGKGESAVTTHAKGCAMMKEYHRWYQEEEKLKVDESKRQGKQHPYFEIFCGAEGSFHKLVID